MMPAASFSARSCRQFRGDTVRIAEIKLGEVTVQMLLAAMLIDALHAAFEDLNRAFDRVGVDEPPNVFLLACGRRVSWLANAIRVEIPLPAA